MEHRWEILVWIEGLLRLWAWLYCLPPELLSGTQLPLGEYAPSLIRQEGI